MQTGANTILTRGPVGDESGQASPTGEFWKEFLRVQIDKFILLGLIIFLWKIGRYDDMKYVIGGLIVAINHNRFKWN